MGHAQIATFLDPAPIGTDGNDLIENPNEGGLYELGLGDDVVITYGHDDTYIYNNGDGHDVIDEGGRASLGDELRLPDFNLADVRFEAEGNDLVLVFAENAATGVIAGSIRLVDALTDPKNIFNEMLESIVLADTTLDVDAVMALLVSQDITAGR